MFYEFCVGVIVDDVVVEDGGGEGSVDFFSVDVFEFVVENEVVFGGINCDSGFFVEENEGEDVIELLM